MNSSSLRCFIVQWLLSVSFATTLNAQWVQTNGPDGGTITTLVVNGTNLFAGGADNGVENGGGVFLSTNNGSSWTAVNTGLTNTNVSALAVSGTNLFAGTYYDGVYLSTNNGSSWTAASTGLTNTNVYAFTVSGTSLFAGTGGGVFLSTNNGTSWAAVNTGLPTNTGVQALAVSGTNLFAGTGGGVFRSTNNGTSWTQSGLPNKNVQALAVNGTNLFAGIYGGGGYIGGVFLSTNSGTNWTAVNTGLTDTNVYALAVSGANLFAGTYGGVFRSTNNGTSWTPANTGLTNTAVLALAVSDTGLFAGTCMRGVFLSTNNGTSWTAASTGMKHTDVFALAVSGANLFAGTYGGVFRSTNNGTSWTPANTGLTVPWLGVFAFAVSETNLFAGTDVGGGVFRSTNDGTSWTATSLTCNNVHALAISGTNLFAGSGYAGVFRSTNNGTSWIVVNTGLTDTSVSALAVSGTNLFAGSYGGGVFLSTNNGTSWTAASTGLTYTYVYALAVSGTNLFAGTYGGGVFLSTNNGTSWTAVNTGLTSTYVNALAVSGTNLFAGTWNDGVFLSTNNGTSWSAVNSGLTNTDVSAFTVSGTNLFAGTRGAGVFRASIPTGQTFVLPMKLFLHDSGGDKDSLEFGTVPGATDGIDPQFGEYELPPLPPTGVFDVRWRITGMQGAKLDIRDTLGGTRTQVTYRGVMQPGSGGYPFTLRWNRMGLPSGTFTLRDELGGSSFVVNMKQRDSLVITDPDIVSFRIIHDRRPTQKLFIRDISGRLDSLEYGTAEGATDGIDWLFGEWELPPLPPTGVFDVRWKITGTQGAKLDVRDTLGGTRTQAIYRGLMQPSDPPGGYPFTLKWNRSEFPTGTFTLRDEIGGSSFVVDMKHQDSLVITDPNIVSFRIIHDRRPTQKLFIRDISGRSDSLEYGTAEGATDSIDWLFGEWELPPIPPTGVFDVRWKITGMQGTKLDIRDTLGGTRTQATYRGLMQPSDLPGGYPFTLQWSRSELPAGTLTLRDAPGGTRFAVDMKQQDSVVITDSDIASFQIIFDRRPAFNCTFQQGWNIMSLPLTVGDRRKNWLFTGSNSNAFAYLPSGYVVRDTLQNGTGYWLKFPSAQDIGIAGELRMRDTIAVAVGWNMIGAISDSVQVTTIQQIPPTIIASQLYGYNAGYSATAMLLPSRGYWVKTMASGLLILSSTSGLNKGALSPPYALDRAATITISDSRVASQTLCFTSELLAEKDLDFFELPPPPPAGVFDARFSTNRMLEAVKEGESATIPIRVSDAQYPLTISWDMKDQSLTASLMIGTTEVRMGGNGSATVSDSKASISLKLGGYSSLPKEFALFQNFPNPFNPSTTIKYDLPKDSRVSLKLFNILGQEVATLVNEEQKAGYRSVQWNANAVASGVYFYRIQAGEFVSTKRLLLLK